MPPVLINGKPGGAIAVTDRGLAYGDGVFETISVADGAPRFWPRHRARLRDGCRKLAIAFDDWRALDEEVRRLAAGSGDAVVKVIVTRGGGARGYRPPLPAKPTRIVTALPPPDYPDDFRRRGVAARFCRKRLADDPDLAGVKHLNRLEQVMARMEWRDEYQEGVMLDARDRVIEGTMSNLFTVEDGGLRTPLLDRCGVSGVMRGWIIEACRRRGIPVQETRLSREDLLRADGVFFCNVLIRAWPVRHLEGARDYDVQSVHGLLHDLLQKLPAAGAED
ncbi:MAG: aminodeoxychorismate lyase [Gammaproteobacteria bacterium]|nr:aminodeoxychorismate lyase [Gammaproteobacteria bacterium]